MQTVAVLCAARRSAYHNIPGVEVYDDRRDMRTFTGGMPVVAHPPCRAWSAYCRHQAKPAPGEAELAVECVRWLRECGGVLEHPAHSRLWDHLGLPLPGQGEQDGLWSLEVLQSWWGDSRIKRTWLLVSGVDPDDVVVPLRLHDPRGDRRRWQVMSKHQRARTHPALAQWLVDLARQSRILMEAD